AYLTWVYTSNCTQTAGGTAKSAGSCSFTMPTITGPYEFRLFRSNSYTRIATSGVVTVVSGNGPLNLGVPSVSGSFAQGQLLTAGPGDWVGAQPVTFAYQWQRCTPYKDVVLGDSATAYWRLGEAQGATTATDLGATPKNGTYTNLPTLGQSPPLSGD